MINFHKYHGAGNDFIMINNLNNKVNFTPQYIKFLCDRHLGIGADGVILVESSDKADCFMNYYNSDGTVAEMCGNGVRCVAKFFLEQTSSFKEELSIDTRAGIKKIICHTDGTYSVDMGAPVFTHNDFPATNPITNPMLSGSMLMRRVPYWTAIGTLLVCEVFHGADFEAEET